MPFQLLKLRLRHVLRQVALQVEHHPRVQEFAVIVLRLVEHLIGFQRLIAVLHIAAVVVAQPGGNVHRHGGQQHLIQRLLVQRLRGIADVIPAIKPHAAGNRRVVNVEGIAFRQIHQAVKQRQKRKQIALGLVLQRLALLLQHRHFCVHFFQIGFIFGVAGQPQATQDHQQGQQRRVAGPHHGAVAQFPPAVFPGDACFLENHVLQQVFNEEALALRAWDRRLFAHRIPARAFPPFR